MKLRIAFVTGVLAAAIAVVPVGSSQPTQNRQATFGNLIAALNNLNVEIRQLNVLSNLTADQIRIVNVDNVLSGNKVRLRVLNRALNRNRVKVLNLRNVLNNNSCSLLGVCSSLNNVLQNVNIAISDVIAINVLSGGDVIVFRDGPGPPALP